MNRYHYHADRYHCHAVWGEMSKWQPIETAPKMPLRYNEGPTILLWVDNDFGVGNFDASRNEFFVEYPEQNDGGKPTHWMPLPAPPNKDNP